MPRGRVNMPPSHFAPRSSHSHPDYIDIDVDVDIDFSEHPQHDSPMTDKATPRQKRPQQYHSDLDHAQRANPEEMAAWTEEIYDRIREYPDPINEYLSSMLPSDTPIPDCPPTDELFTVIPTTEGTLEATMYGPLVTALSQLVSSFPLDVRPQFYNYGHKTMYFPYKPYESEQHSTKPDVIATIPALPVVEPTYQWRHVALVFELKSESGHDPMVQLAKSARNILFSQGRLFAFVVGIYGDQARIYRFDRAGAMCSRRFEYKKRPEIFHEFLWRLLHPRLSECRLVGEDPTMTPGTGADLDEVRSLTKARDPKWASTQKTVRRIIVTDKQKNETTYLAYKLLFAYKVGEEEENKGRRYVVKESWRQLGRFRESDFYEALRDATGGEPIFGVASFIHAEELGDRDEEERKREANARRLRSQSRAPPGMTLVGYRTIAGAHNAPEMGRLNERSHTRLVLETVGTPLARFKRTKQLAMALRDAIEGRVIHRDISEGNVMIAPEGAAFSGFIQDLDYSFNWKWFLHKRETQVDLAKWEEYCVQHGHEPRSKKDPDNDSKERTGTVFFMAVEILQAEITHEARHDLESFYWLLVFIVLRHTKHGHHLETGAFGSLFCHSDWDQCVREKKAWLIDEKAPLAVPGNEPLTSLLEKLRKRTTHRDILDIFDTVLAEDVVWPDNDAALVWKLPQTATLPPEMAKSVGQSVQPGSLDPRTGDKRESPRPPPNDDDQQGMIAGVSSGDAATGQVQQGAGEKYDAATQAAVDEPADEEIAFWQGRPASVQPAVQPKPSTSQPRARKETRAQVGRGAKSGRRAESPPAAKRPATRKRAAPSRSVAETWPASHVDAEGASSGHRYNLRSSSRRNLAVPSTSDAVDVAPIAGRRTTRSRAQATSKEQDTGSRDSSVGKRGRAREEPDGIEEDPESQSSKRQRTLSQPRGRKTAKKQGKKP
ncbi:uncharacterized protein B0H18DRAFT_1042164 [Fomitopsis serialis]|uniref:uncharacterized protein n=1 Tax=Fomitopsis serialis TaxID=139415 RepID=UPI0020073504|nr:uncharacterized protein B0H18DRAFT_1042164 [Neoantrodia serialis]KAH9915211.1 hypothetical protein B0H18DRAFT_1042164 [Neoantrodia serialis]